MSLFCLFARVPRHKKGHNAIFKRPKIKYETSKGKRRRRTTTIGGWPVRLICVAHRLSSRAAASSRFASFLSWQTHHTCCYIVSRVVHRPTKCRTMRIRKEHGPVNYLIFPIPSPSSHSPLLFQLAILCWTLLWILPLLCLFSFQNGLDGAYGTVSSFWISFIFFIIRFCLKSRKQEENEGRWFDLIAQFKLGVNRGA